jgi:hypothetical protein
VEHDLDVRRVGVQHEGAVVAAVALRAFAWWAIIAVSGGERRRCVLRDERTVVVRRVPRARARLAVGRVAGVACAIEKSSHSASCSSLLVGSIPRRRP